ncbi:MAG: stalk domain-containing protein [Eubacteriales bacterium]
MNMKRMTAMALSGIMVCGLLMQVGAVQEVPISSPVEEEDAAVTMPDSVLYYGTVKQVDKDENGQATRVWMESERYGELVMLVNEDTCFVDGGRAVEGNPETMLVEGQGLYVYHSPITTYSLPGQTQAYVFVGEMPMDMACPKYHIVEAVEQNEDGSIRITTDNGGLHLTVEADAVVNDYLTKRHYTVADIQKGDRIMAWYDEVQESYPAQTSTKTVILLDKAEEEEPEVGSAIYVGDEKLQQAWREENQVPMVPVRAVAEALGLDVGFEVQDGKALITVENEEFSVHVTPGVENGIYGVTKIPDAVGMTGPQDYGAAPYIEDPGVTWVPAEMFEMLDVTITEAEDGLHFDR